MSRQDFFTVWRANPFFVLEVPIEASPAEIAENPRARSAKLRFAVRTEAPAQPLEPALVSLAHLPQKQTRRGG